MAPIRRLSQRISEGDGISIIVRVDDLDAACAAEEQGAEALAVDRVIEGIREATTLPLLWLGPGPALDADAIVVGPDYDGEFDIEVVIGVCDEDELESALEEHDPEIFLLSPRRNADDGERIESVLELLPDVPAGKLAIAEAAVERRDEVLALERAGFDAVLVPPGQVGMLVGASHPDV
ncbi:MAG: hypothetical protein WCH31_07745 [Actinomycetes bacterium]